MQIALCELMVFYTSGPNSVLVLDNCTLHFSETISALLAKANIELIYLPPYSPDFNPIELCFGQLQTIMQRAAYFSQRYPVETLFMAMEEISISNMRAYYRKCGLLPKTSASASTSTLHRAR